MLRNKLRRDKKRKLYCFWLEVLIRIVSAWYGNLSVAESTQQKDLPPKF